MLLWLPYLILNYITLVIHYILTPFVVLFCSEDGNLPGVLKYFQTWDDTCDPRFYVTGIVPEWARYDYDRHYEEYWGADDKLAALGRDRCYTKILDPNFTLKEKLQRYYCRVSWLWRNQGYGFSFYVFGRTVDPTTSTVTEANDIKKGFCLTETTKARPGLFQMLFKPFVYKNDARINDWLKFKIFIGWKLPMSGEKPIHCMLANRIWVKFSKIESN